jgi:mono/diheme cytochrome c family protein
LLFLSSFCLPLAACEVASAKAQVPVATQPSPAKAVEELPLTQQDHDEAETQVAAACTTCHGKELVAQQRITRKQWEAVLKKMTTWGAPLDPAAAVNVARHLSETYPSNAPAFVPQPISPKAAVLALAPMADGVFATGDVVAGESGYRSLCIACHAEGGKGSGLGPSLIDNPALFRAPELFKLVQGGRGRMPGFETVTKRQVADILAFLRAQN